MRVLPLLVVSACVSGADAPKRWLRWVPLTDQDDPYARYCGPDFAFLDAEGAVWDRTTGELRPLAEPVPTNALGERGPVTCTGQTLFTTPPRSVLAYRSVSGGPWEAIPPPEGAGIHDVRASHGGSVYRLVASTNGVVGVQVEQSDDEGATWESLGAPLPNPGAGGTPVQGSLLSVDRYVQAAIFDANGTGGQVRISLTGTELVLSVDNFRSLDSPSPFAATATVAIAYDPNRDGRPQLHFPSYSMTSRDPIRLAAEAWDEVMMAGPPQLLEVPAPAQHPEAFNVELHPDGHLIRRDGYRTTTAIDTDLSAEVLAGPGCSVLDHRVQTLAAAVGPGAVSLTNTGSEALYVGSFQTTRLQWFTGDGVGPATPFDPGQTWSIDAARPVFVMDAEGRCRGVLGERDGGAHDLGDW